MAHRPGAVTAAPTSVASSTPGLRSLARASQLKSYGYAGSTAVVGLVSSAHSTTVSLFCSKRASLQVDSLAVDIVAKAKSPRSDAELSLARLDPFELLDRVGSATVIRVVLENGGYRSKASRKVGVPACQLFEGSVKVGGGPDRKGRRHFFRRRLVFATGLEVSASSASNSSMGRVLPSRMSSLLFRICSWGFGSRASR